MTFVRPMFRRLLILLLILLAAPAAAQPARTTRSSRSWSRKGRRCPAARSSWRSSCAPSPAGTAIGSTRAMPACRWTSNGSFRRASRAGPLRYPVPTRLTIAGLMNYVYERDYAVLVRLKVPAGASGSDPDPRRGAVAGLHRQDLRSRSRDDRARPAGRGGTAERASAVRRMAPRFCQGRWRRRRISLARRPLARRDPAAARARRSAIPMSFRRRRPGRLCCAAAIPPQRRYVGRRTPAKARRARRILRRAGARRRARPRIRARPGTSRKAARRLGPWAPTWCCSRSSAHCSAEFCST